MDVITTLHLTGTSDNLYPNIKKENIPATSVDYNKLDVDVKNLIGRAVSASPRGIYSTYSALVSAYPEGAEGTFIVTSNNHWYYFNSTWLDGGVYSASVSDKIMSNGNGSSIKCVLDKITITSGRFTITTDRPATLNGEAILTSIPDASVTTAKVVDGAINTDKVIDGAITKNKIESGIIDTIDTLKLEVANLNAIIHDTVAKTAEETYEAINVLNTPSSVTVEGTAYPVIDNTRMLLAGVKGNTVKCANIWNEQWELGGYGTNTGNPYGASTVIRSKNSIEVLPNTSYAYKISQGSITILEYASDNSYIGFKQTNPFTTSSTTKYIKLSFDLAYGNTYLNDTILISGSAIPTIYQPYFTGLKKSTLSGLISNDSRQNHLDEVIFNVQSLNGVGTAHDELVIIKNSDNEYYTMKKITRMSNIDLGSLTWDYYDEEGHQRFIATINGMHNASSNNKPSNVICATYVTASWSSMYNHTNAKVIATYATASYVGVYDSTYTNAVDFKTAMNGVNICYELATPIETTISNTLTYSDVTFLTKQNGTIEVQDNDNLSYLAKPDLILDLEIKYWED